MKNFLASFFVLLVSTSTAFAAGKARVTVAAKSIAGNKIELTFQTTPADGLAINGEGPWSLDVVDAGKITPAKKSYKRPEWKSDVAGFVVTADASGQKSADIKYKLVAFICTKDKTQCFREVVDSTATVTW